MRIYQALTLAVVVCMCGSARAESVAIQNASFEDPVLNAGGWTNELVDWDGPPVAGDSFIEYIAGFSSDGNQHIGIQATQEVSQDLGVPVKPNTQYTLTLGVGKRNANFSPAGQASTFGLYAGGDFADGGTLLGEATYDASGLPDLTFVDQSVVITTSDAIPTGNLFLSLRTTGAGRAHYDNIRLDAIPIPEPSSMVLAGLAALGCLIVRRKR